MRVYYLWAEGVVTSAETSAGFAPTTGGEFLTPSEQIGIARLVRKKKKHMRLYIVGLRASFMRYELPRNG